jgi:hypothetical protein
MACDYRVKVDDSKLLGYLSLYELGWTALRRGDAQTAQVLVNRLVSLATPRADLNRAHLLIAVVSANFGLSLAQSACAVSHELLHAAEAHAENSGGVAHTELVVVHEPLGGLSPGGDSLPRQLLCVGLLGAVTGGQRDSIGVDAGVVHHDDHCGGVHVEPWGDEPWAVSPALARVRVCPTTSHSGTSMIHWPLSRNTCTV